MEKTLYSTLKGKSAEVYHVHRLVYTFADNIQQQACGDESVTDRYNLLLNSAYGRLSEQLYNNLQNLSKIAESFLNISQTGMPIGTHGFYRRNSTYPNATCPQCTYEDMCNDDTLLLQIYSEEGTNKTSKKRLLKS